MPHPKTKRSLVPSCLHLLPGSCRLLLNAPKPHPDQANPPAAAQDAVVCPICNRFLLFSSKLRLGKQELQAVAVGLCHQTCGLASWRRLGLDRRYLGACVLPAAEQCTLCSVLCSFEKQTGSELRNKMGSNPKVMITF